jgi:hypothetical protein
VSDAVVHGFDWNPYNVNMEPGRLWGATGAVTYRNSPRMPASCWGRAGGEEAHGGGDVFRAVRGKPDRRGTSGLLVRAPREPVWAQASYPAVHDFLTNPAYAGAFVFGAPAPKSARTRAARCPPGSGSFPASSGRC